MTSDIVALEVRLLLLKYGREPVMRALSAATHATDDELKASLSNQIHSTKARKRKRELKPEEFVESRSDLDPNRKTLVKTLAQRYMSRRFLGSWAEIDDFVRSHGVETLRTTNRQRAWPVVYEILARLPFSDLSELEKENAARKDKSDYEVLAGGILRAE
jgi:hypothetical protein